MNKYQEAFNHIVDYGVEVEYFNKQADKPEEESTIMIVSKALDKLETCIELLEKATPKKVKHIMNNVIYGDHHSTGYCPNCNTYLDIPSEVWYHVLAETDYFSCGCGQKLDWSDTD